MGLWRPATRIRFWTPKYRNRPYVQPPALLKIISVLSVVSIIGTVVYYLMIVLGDVVASTSIEPASAIYVSVLHFLLPFTIALSISTNSPLSRPLIVLYFLVLCGATMLGKGFAGGVDIDGGLKATISVAVFLAVSAWLFLGPKVRAYYALLAGDDVPMGTGDQAVELIEDPWPGKKARATIEWLADHLETLVLLGLIAAVVLGWRSMA